jgi:hypothetical protein
VDGWLGGWMDGSKSRFKGCLQQSKKDGIAYTVTQNCAPYAIWIKRIDPIRFAEHHTE